MSRTVGRVFVGCEVPPEIKSALQRESFRRSQSGKAVSESDLIREALTRYLLSSSINEPVMAFIRDQEGRT